MANLASRHCTPLKKGTKPISRDVAKSLLNSLHKDWQFNENTTCIERVFKFANFHETVNFVNAIAWIANNEDHHPNLEVGYNNCTVSYSTHAADGLTVNDFICAAKIDALIKLDPSIAQKTKKAVRAAVTPPPPTPKPAVKSADVVEDKPAPKPDVPTPKFDASEAEALLSEEITAPVVEPIIDDDDDFDPLVDPDEIKLEASKKAAKPAEPTTEEKINSAVNAVGKNVDAVETVIGGQTNYDLASTVILPPGTEPTINEAPNSANSKGDEGPAATVIMPPDREETGIMPANGAQPSQEEEDIIPPQQPSSNSNEYLKTVALSEPSAPHKPVKPIAQNDHISTIIIPSANIDLPSLNKPSPSADARIEEDETMVMDLENLHSQNHE